MDDYKTVRKTIILAGGGTAGHITPLLAISRQLLAKSSKLRLIIVIDRGSRLEYLVSESGLPIIVKKIYAGKYRRYSNFKFFQRIFSFKRNVHNIKDLFLLGVGVFQGLWLIRKYKPSVVFSKGGYASLPVALAAVVSNKPIVTHDSDSIPGLANRLVSRFAKKIAIGVPSLGLKKSADSRVVVTGVPVASSFINLRDQSSQKSKEAIGLPKDCLLMLVGGSTQGAKAIDDAVELIVPHLLKNYLNLHIVHVFGKLNEESISSRYESIDSKHRARLHLKTFLNDQYKYVAAADLVITRAGATALAEYGVLGKACIVIPAEHLTGGHQLLNANGLESAGAVVVIRQSQLKDQLLGRVEYLLQHESDRILLGHKLQEITPLDASSRVADLILGEL